MPASGQTGKVSMAFSRVFATVLALKLVPAIKPHYLTDIPSVAKRPTQRKHDNVAGNWTEPFT